MKLAIPRQAQPFSKLFVDEDAYNLHYASSFYHPNNAVVPIKAAGNSRAANSYTQIPHSAQCTFDLAAGRTVCIWYYPEQGTDTAHPRPIVINETIVGNIPGSPSATAFDAVTEQLAYPAGTYFPDDITSVLPAPLDALNQRREICVLKGHMTVECIRSNNLDALPFIQAIGAADAAVTSAMVSVRPTTAYTTWQSACEAASRVPTLDGVLPAATPFSGYLTSVAPPESGTSAIVYHYPKLEQTGGSNWYTLETALVGVAGGCGFVAGFSNVATTTFSPVITVRNTSANPVSIVVRSNTVYGLPAAYLDTQLLETMICREPNTVQLDTELQLSLSRGATRSTPEDTALGLTMANLQALAKHGNRKNSSQHGMVGAARAIGVHRKLDSHESASLLRGSGDLRVAPQPTPAQLAADDTISRRVLSYLSRLSRDTYNMLGTGVSSIPARALEIAGDLAVGALARNMGRGNLADPSHLTIQAPRPVAS